MSHIGTITLIGAGPGDPELLTIKAMNCLQKADVILHDSLINQDMLNAFPQAEKILVGKKGYGPSCRQDDINKLLISLAQQGKNVARLKGGDPLIFSRAGEEIEAIRTAGIPLQVIPGITTAQAAAASLALPLTHRHHARRLQFVTGHDHKGGLPQDVDWQALADPKATTVVYMPKRTLRAFCETLKKHGLPASTPSLAATNVSLPSEHTINGTIETLPQQLEEARFDGPVIIIIGQVTEIP